MTSLRKNQTGFSAVEAILIVVIVGLIGFVGWYVWHARVKTTPGVSSQQSSSTTSAQNSDTASIKARDATRDAAMRSIQAETEAYFAQNGYYPTLANLNSASWRSTNMSEFDASTLQDPSGTAATLVSTPQKNAYSYLATPSGCDNSNNNYCTGYTLTATLEAGGVFTKQSLN